MNEMIETNRANRFEVFFKSSELTYDASNRLRLNTFRVETNDAFNLTLHIYDDVDGELVKILHSALHERIQLNIKQYRPDGSEIRIWKCEGVLDRLRPGTLDWSSTKSASLLVSISLVRWEIM